MRETLDRLNGDFTKLHPEIEIEPVFASGYPETEAMAVSALSSAAPPQMMVGLAKDLFGLIDRDLITAYSDIAGTPDDYAWYNSFYAGFLENSRFARKVYSVPFQRSTVIMFYNKAAFAEAGLDPEHPPANWQEMREDARRLTKKDADGRVSRWGIEIAGGDQPYWMFQALAIQQGLVLSDEEGLTTRFDEPRAIEALDYWMALVRDGVTPPGSLGWDASTPEDFLSGRAAMIWTSTGQFANIRQKANFFVCPGHVAGGHSAGHRYHWRRKPFMWFKSASGGAGSGPRSLMRAS